MGMRQVHLKEMFENANENPKEMMVRNFYFFFRKLTIIRAEKERTAWRQIVCVVVVSKRCRYGGCAPPSPHWSNIEPSTPPP